jgi:prephenate dehydratase
LEDIKEIRSQSYILDQCSQFLSSLEGSKEIFVSQAKDSAQSAARIQSEKLKNVGAICGARAAQLYGLEVLQSGLEDDTNTMTRYVLVGTSPATPERHLNPKTFLAITCRNQVGAFFKVLSCFALRDIKQVFL